MLHLIAAAMLCTTPNAEVQLIGGVTAKAVDHANVPMGTEVDVRLTIEPNGKMYANTSGVSIARSSGNTALDQAAIDDAQRSSYAPKIINCTPVSSTYVFRARYDSQTDYLVWYSSWEYWLNEKAHPRPTPEPRPYVRFCTSLQNVTDAEFAQKLAEREQETRNQLSRARAYNRLHGIAMPASVTDAEVIAAVKVHDPSARTVRILVPEYQEFALKPGESVSPNKSYAVEIQESDNTTRLSVAVFSPEKQFLRLDPLTKQGLTLPYGFAREMAAYILLNDLMGGDNPIPRQGCVRGVTMQLGTIRGAMPEITAAMLTEPQRDPVAEKRALDAYRVFVTSRDARENPMTKQTLAQLGSSPEITFVYRDQDTLIGGDPELDVVRIAHGTNRTYAMLGITADGKASMSSPALCFVGDQHCAPYYIWP